MLIRIRRSKDLLEQFQEFECSSLFAFNYCVYCTTCYNTCGRTGTKWLFFFTFTEECCVVMEKNIGKKLPNRISDQVWYKRCLKETFGRGVQICEGGSISASGFGQGSKSAMTPAKESLMNLFAQCKVIRITESRKFLLVESGILGIGIQNPAKEWIQNPLKSYRRLSRASMHPRSC